MNTWPKHYLFPLIVLSLFIGIKGIQAQTPVPQLDQPMLMKQLIGTWQNEFAPDTSIIWEIKSYGKGLEAHYKFTTKGKTYREVKQLTGFDSKFETFITYTLFLNGRFILFTGKFTSNDKMHVEVKDPMNPQKVLSRSEYEFKNADMFTVTRLFGNYGAKPGIYCRIKK
jgi:hypothetical protein